MAFKCSGMNAAGTGKNAYPTQGEVSAPMPIVFNLPLAFHR